DDFLAAADQPQIAILGDFAKISGADPAIGRAALNTVVGAVAEKDIGTGHEHFTGVAGLEAAVRAANRHLHHGNGPAATDRVITSISALRGGDAGGFGLAIELAHRFAADFFHLPLQFGGQWRAAGYEPS